MEEAYNRVLFTGLSIGDKFSTFQDFEKKIKDVQDATHVQLWFRDSRTLEGAKKRYPGVVSKANKQLKYYSITLVCVCGGRKYSRQCSDNSENAPLRNVA